MYLKIQNLPAYFDEVALRGLIAVTMTQKFSKSYTDLIKNVINFYSSIVNNFLPHDEIFKECKVWVIVYASLFKQVFQCKQNSASTCIAQINITIYCSHFRFYLNEHEIRRSYFNFQGIEEDFWRFKLISTFD